MDPDEEKAFREKVARNGWNIVFPPGRIRLGFQPVPECLRDPALWEGFDEYLAARRGERLPEKTAH
ncbi:hypothetical protein BH11ARM2_BH11ARM2_26140 [soil metagenome]